MNNVDVASVIDEGRWSGYQKLLVAGTALAIVLDGMDNQLLGNVIPALMREWQLPRAPFTAVLAMAPLGMMIGGATGGMLGDRVGRRTALLVSVLSFAVPTLAIAAVDGVAMLGVFRSLAGLGLGGDAKRGGAPPPSTCAATAASISASHPSPSFGFRSAARWPPRSRAGSCRCMGWRALFVIGGVIPLAVAILLYLLLPGIAARPRHAQGAMARACRAAPAVRP